jgi:hypothetical protein
MVLQRFGTAILIAVTILMATAAAQTKNEVAGVIGRTFLTDHLVPNTNFFDNTVHYGKGLTFQGNYGRRILGNEGLFALTFEVPVVFTPSVELNYGINTIPKEYRAYFVTPSLRLNIFAANAVSPWVSFGGGIGHFGESSELLFGGTNPGKTGTTTGVFQIGGGLDVRVWHAFSVRGEVRDFSSGVPQLNVDTGKSRQRNLFVGGGVVWHF